jgi:hypothetical protein
MSYGWGICGIFSGWGMRVVKKVVGVVEEEEREHRT